MVSSSEYDAVKAQINSVVGTQPTASSHAKSSWDLEIPSSVSATTRTSAPQLILTVATSDVEQEHLNAHGPGVFEIAFRVEKGHAGEANSPFGRLVWEE